MKQLQAACDQYAEIVGVNYEDWVPGEDVDADACAWAVVNAALRLEGADKVRPTDIALRLDLGAPSTVANWEKRYPDFPEPIETVGDEGTRQTKLYDWFEIRAWYVCHMLGGKKRMARAMELIEEMDEKEGGDNG